MDPALVPELLVGSVAVSTEFWCGVCGFEIRYERPEEGFAYVVLGGAHVMLEEVGAGRNWVTAALERPLGRGVNLQVAVPSIAPIVESLRRAGRPLFMEPEIKWYRTDHGDVGVEQFLVTDPDGYLIRFQASVSRTLEVDGERFEVSTREGHPGTFDYTWLTGPNPGYGFTESGSSDHTRTDADHHRAIGDFLSGINPATGYLD
ncbi:catechol 2,3-dioxygenase-like lactoylglutathione lyase family enzyme [Kribbella aluminosa]|uniref:Bleomycin resistance protein n=1 Tax=Kribbella aluminosa TaxID=416017 RepID=A0ABS4UW82_9ACTN|nr:VOC family protein [Kribbella aluminosa]MBP2355876.1 catechol 2,3-dioxygenase-like lactoylglutathione lyase family enzyme [Kribbella aluminosa]